MGSNISPKGAPGVILAPKDLGFVCESNYLLQSHPSGLNLLVLSKLFYFF